MSIGTAERILIVDDNSDSLVLYARILEKGGFTVARARSAAEVIPFMRGEPPDLVLLDVVLPDKNGFDLLREIRALPELAEIPVVFLSSQKTSADDQAAGLDAGAEGYIARPVAPAELCARVRLHLRQSELARQLRASEARYRAEAERTRLLRDPGERVKELSLLHHVGEILNGVPAPPEKTLQSIAARMPAGFLFPDALLARITLGETEHTSGPWPECPCASIAESFDLGDGTGGRIEVAYSARPGEAEDNKDLFIPEERQLLASLADMLRRHLERLRAEEALSRSQTLLRIAGHAARIGGWTVELPERRLTWSDEVYAIHEMPAGSQPTLEEAIHFYPPECREEIARQVEACIRDETPFNFEAQIITAKGNRIWVHAIGEAVRSEDGSIVRVQGAFQDISRRKAAEASAEEHERRFRQLAEAMPMIVWTAQPDGTIDYANKRMFELIDADPEEDVHTCWQPFVHPEDLPDVMRLWGECVAAETPYEQEYRVRSRESGEYHWIRVQSTPVRDTDGKVMRWYGTGMDIHAVRSLQKEATCAAERFTRTLESITEGFSIVDREWRVRYVNPALEKMIRTTRDEMLGHMIWDLFPDAVGTAFEKAYREAMDENRSVRVEEYYAPSAIWVEQRVFPSSEGICVLTRDVTEERALQETLHESEERFRTLLDDVPTVAVQGYRPDGTILYWNKASEALYGYTPEEALGRNLLDLIVPPEMHEKVLAEFMAVETGAGAIPTGELNRVRKDGSRIDVLSSHAVLRRPGRPVELFCIDVDLTERKELEARFLRTQRLESIGTLAGGIAHDLNNMLSPIIMGVSLMRQLTEDESLRTLIDNIQNSAEHGRDLVKQVLSFARGVEGKRVPVNLRYLVREVQSIIANTFPKDISFECNLPPDLWTVPADPTQLDQVLLNLCVNARDAMPEGGRIRIHAENLRVDQQYASMFDKAEPGPYVAITVEDDGTGIPPEIIDRIFDPFFTTKEVGQGTGLGLSTAMGIVRSHGGFMNVQSEPAKGTRFKIFLPADPQGDCGERTVETRPGSIPRGKGGCVLLVDDEATVREMTRQSLETFGYTVITTEDGAHALAVFASRKDEIDLVLTNIRMPVMGGIALIRALRRISPNLLIIAASGLKTESSDAKTREAGVNRLLAKPYTTGTLLRAVHDLLHGK